MNSDFQAGMAEATRLTREGRLAQAGALIQRLLAGGATPAATDAPAAAPPAPDATAPETPPAGKRPGLRATVRRLVERARAVGAESPAGAPPLPGGARFETAVHREGGAARDYRLYVPANRGEDRMPLVLMLHGCTQTPDDFARGTGMNALAEEFGCIVAYPAQPGSANQNRCWNWFRPEDQRRDGGEPALLAGIARAVTATERVDPDRVYVAGLSAGGAAAATLGSEYPEIFAAVGVHSGLPHGAAQDLPSALSAMRQGASGAVDAKRTPPTVVFHGDADRVVHPRNGEAVAAQAIAGAASTRSVAEGAAGGRRWTLARHADPAGGTLCEHWTVHGAGHAWSGGDGAGSYADAQGPDASREMLRFFLTHRR